MKLHFATGRAAAATILKFVAPSRSFCWTTCLIAVATCYFLAANSAHAETFYTYQGQINGNPATFKLCWLGDSVVGTCDSDSKTFALAGDNSRKGEIFTSVAYLGRTLAHMLLRKTMTDEQVIWKGSMRVDENGQIVPVTFIYNRTQSSAQAQPQDTASGDSSIAGVWQWLPRDQEVTINPDGTCSSNYNVSGNWTLVDADNRTYQIKWDSGFVDTLALSADANRLTGSNQYGDHDQPFLRVK